MRIPKSCQEWIDKQRTRKFDFQEQMEWEYNLIKDLLPVKCNSVLDIGCGIGGIDVMIYQHYYFKPKIYLFDFIDQMYDKKIQYGFNEKYYGYNSKEQTIKFMNANGVKQYEYIDASAGIPITKLTNVDLIISLLSWGYHYSVDTYIEQVLPILSDDGILIMDIRQETNGLDTLAKYFSSVKIIATANKAHKTVAKKIRW